VSDKTTPVTQASLFKGAFNIATDGTGTGACFLPPHALITVKTISVNTILLIALLL
jgi:hypothetical protein